MPRTTRLQRLMNLRRILSAADTKLQLLEFWLRTMSDRKQIVLEFYSNRLEEEGCTIDGFGHFMRDKRIGRVELLTIADWGKYGYEADYDTVEIERITTPCPQQVLEAFELYLCVSRQILAEIFAFKVPVEGHDTYLLGISGTASDGYDSNFGHFAEVFDESGQLLGAAMLAEGEKPSWLDHPIEQTDGLDTANLMWAEELAVRTEQDGEITRIVMTVPE